MPDYRTLLDKPYLGHWDLPVGRDAVATISKVVAGEVTGASGKTQKKPIIFFEGKEKGFPFNTTNCKTVASMYGNNTDGWVGKRISMYVTKTRMGPDEVDCIRVRPTVPKQSKIECDPGSTK